MSIYYWRTNLLSTYIMNQAKQILVYPRYHNEDHFDRKNEGYERSFSLNDAWKSFYEWVSKEIWSILGKWLKTHIAVAQDWISNEIATNFLLPQLNDDSSIWELRSMWLWGRQIHEHDLGDGHMRTRRASDLLAWYCSGLNGTDQLNLICIPSKAIYNGLHHYLKKDYQIDIRDYASTPYKNMHDAWFTTLNLLSNAREALKVKFQPK